MAKKQVYLVVLDSTDEHDAHVLCAFSTEELAQEYIDTQIDTDPVETRSRHYQPPVIRVLSLDKPIPPAKKFVTVWHTCIDISTGHFGAKGYPTRDVSKYALDYDEVTPTAYNWGYVNAYSRKSAEDSIQRALKLAEEERKRRQKCRNTSGHQK
jgi:hypothetical protein